MRTCLLLILAAVFALAISACQTDPVKQIPALEQALAATNSNGAADSLLLLYEAAVNAHPDNHADNLQYLSRAADLRFFRKKDAVGAVRLIHTALAQHGEGQSLAEPVGLLARIWCAYQYKSTPDLSRNPEDIDQMRTDLEANQPWMDTSLVRLDKLMGGPAATIKTHAEAFIQISEAYSTLVKDTDPNKFVDLIMRAAGLAKTVGEPNKALRFYYNVAETIPGHPKAPTALFMMGFIYENDLKDMDKARETYELFLKRYPKDPDYVDDAQNALKYLGMSPEDIIKQFEQNPQ